MGSQLNLGVRAQHGPSYRTLMMPTSASVRGCTLPRAASVLWRIESRLGAALLLVGGACYALGADSAATSPPEHADAGMMLLVPGFFTAVVGAALFILALTVWAPGRLRWAGHIVALICSLYLALALR